MHQSAYADRALTKGDIYRSSSGDESIKIVSNDDLELTQGSTTYLGKYTIDDSLMLRLVVTRMGATEVIYYVMNGDSVLTQNGTNRNLFNQKPLNGARQLHLALQTAALDRKSSGRKDIGWPADIGATSAAAVRRMLVSNRYLTDEDLTRINFEQFLIGNVSERDSSDTILLKIPSTSPDMPVVIFLKGGDGAVLKSTSGYSVKDPPRNPAFLE